MCQDLSSIEILDDIIAQNWRASNNPFMRVQIIADWWPFGSDLPLIFLVQALTDTETRLQQSFWLHVPTDSPHPSHPLTTPEPWHEWDLAVIEVGLLERDMDMDMRIMKRNLTLGWWPASPRNAVMISRTRLASDAVIDLVHRSSSVACGFTFPICSLTNHLRSIRLVYTNTRYQNTNNLLLYFCHEHVNCWKLILTVIRPLNVIYFDGSGAAKMPDRWSTFFLYLFASRWRAHYLSLMDSQDVVAFCEISPEKYSSEKERVDNMCEWGKHFNVDGFVRCVSSVILWALSQWLREWKWACENFLYNAMLLDKWAL